VRKEIRREDPSGAPIMNLRNVAPGGFIHFGPTRTKMERTESACADIDLAAQAAIYS
jgi:hypothetical protein